MKKKIIAAAVLAIISISATAQNLGFETGDTTGWSGSGLTAVGDQTVQAGSNTWLVKPYGTYMGRIDILSGTSFTQMSTALGLSSASTTGIQNMLNTQAGRVSPITTAGWAYRTVNLTAGDSFSLAWQYISTDYVPFNDGSIASLVRVGSATTLGVINNYAQQYALLGFTNPGTGDYSTNSYGATGWQISTYSVTESGDYILGFGVFNLDDQTLSPVLFIDEQQGTTTKNGVTFGAVAPNPGTLAPTTPTGPTTPTTPPLVNDVTGNTTVAQLGTTPVLNGGTLQMASDSDITQNIGISSNGGTINTNGTTSTISGVISDSGAGPAGGLTITDSQNIGGTVSFSGTNTYTGTTTINQGAFLILLNGGAVAQSSNVTNNGGLNITGAGDSTVISGNFTQGSTGGLIATLTPTGATQLNATGEVSLAGTYTLHANQGPYAYGKYTLITGNEISGQFNTFATNLDPFYGNYLKYSADKVQLYITPNAIATQSSINSVASSLGDAINLQSSTTTNSLGSDCNLFGNTGSCVSVNFNQTAAAGGDLNTGGITLGKRINDNWRVGVFTNSPMNSTSVGTIDVKSNTAYGGYIGWNKNADGTGLGITASAAQGNGAMKLTRNGPEVGVGTSSTDSKAYQVRATYAVPVSETVTVTPYVGVRRTETNVAGYTEQGPVFPLTVNGTSQSAIDVIAGATVGKQFTDKLSGSVTAGVIQTVSQNNPAFTGTSEISGMNTFSGVVPSNGSTNPALSAGISYNINKTTRVGTSIGWQQRGANSDITTIGISITKGF